MEKQPIDRSLSSTNVERSVALTFEQLGRQIVALYREVKPGDLELIHMTGRGDPGDLMQLIDQALEQLAAQQPAHRFSVHEYRQPIRIGDGRTISRIAWSESSTGEKISSYYYVVLLPDDDPNKGVPDSQRVIKFGRTKDQPIVPATSSPSLSESLTPIEPERMRYSVQVLRSGELVRIEAENFEHLQHLLHQHFVLETLQDQEVQARGWNVSANLVLRGRGGRAVIEMRDRKIGNVMDRLELQFNIDEVIES